MSPSQGRERGLQMGQGPAPGHMATLPDLLPGLSPPGRPHTLPLRAEGRSSLSLRRAHSPRFFQLFLSNGIYNKLCLNFCLSDNNNNTIIIWSITYSQLYLIKAVISLRVSGSSKRQELYHPHPSVGTARVGSGAIGAEAPEAGGCRWGPAPGVRVLAVGAVPRVRLRWPQAKG